MIDDTLALISNIKLLNKHLWGDEEEITIVNTYNLAMATNRLNSFLGWGKDRLATPKSFHKWEFWQFICKALGEEISEAVRALLKSFSLRSKLNSFYQLLCLLAVWWLAWLSRCSQCNKINGGILDPPIIRFTPLPGIEIGGCARNDSLPAPAIN
jgi:hypothetical protein